MSATPQPHLPRPEANSPTFGDASRSRRLLHVVTVPDSLLFFDGQLAFMKRHGYEIALVASPGPELDEFGRREHIIVHPIEMPRRVTPFRDALSLARLYRFVREFRPDIAHTHTAKGGLIGTLASALGRTPVRIYQMRGRLSATAVGWKRASIVATERIVCGAATHVISNSRSLREGAVRDGLCKESKIEVLLAGSGNGVDSSVRFNPDQVGRGKALELRQSLGILPGDLVVGFVGRLVRDKGIRELAQAWERIRREHANAHLVVAGDFEPRDPVSASDRIALENDPRVHLLGFRKDAALIYATMNVLVLPTYREGFPNVLLEAMSMRVPVVSTLVDGCVDAVEPGVTGVLVPSRDAPALAEATIRYLVDGALRRQHGLAGRERVLKFFDRERLWEALLGVYECHLERVQSGTSRRPGTAPFVPENPS